MLLKGLPRQQFLLPACATWRSGFKQQHALNSSFRNLKLGRDAEKRAQPTLLEELFPEESESSKKTQNSSDANIDAQGPPRGRLIQQFVQAMSKHRDGTLQIYDSSKAPSHIMPMTDEDAYELKEYNKASVLVLNNASKSLVLSDFLRLSPKGTHIDNWAHGIIRVIPGRSPQTLQPLSNYFIVFSSPAAAMTYFETIKRLHRISRVNTPSSPSSRLPPPPGYTRNGEDIYALVQAFTLVPPSLPHSSCRMMKRPFSYSVDSMIKSGGLIASQTRRRLRRYRRIAGSKDKNVGGEGEEMEDGRGSDMVLLTLQEEGENTILPNVVANLIEQDGKERNLPWILGRNGCAGIVHLQTKAEVEAEVKGEVKAQEQKSYESGNSNSTRGGSESKSQESIPRRRRNGDARFILTFKDPRDARRFVRGWHRRPLILPAPPLKSGLEPERPTLMSAELIW